MLGARRVRRRRAGGGALQRGGGGGGGGRAAVQASPAAKSRYDAATAACLSKNCHIISIFLGTPNKVFIF